VSISAPPRLNGEFGQAASLPVTRLGQHVRYHGLLALLPPFALPEPSPQRIIGDALGAQRSHVKRVHQAGIGSPLRAPVVDSPETPAPRPRGAPYLLQGRWAGAVPTPPFLGQATLRGSLNAAG
jgi:hypothetical protein